MFSVEDIFDIIVDISIVVLTLLLLSGCASTTPPSKPQTFHPEWPAPYQVCDVDWKVIEFEGQPYVAVTYDDNIDLALCMKDVIRYIKDINQKFCYYRPSEDMRCAADR